MKMTSLQVRLIKTPYPHPGGETFYTIRIDTDEGIYGLGESMPHYAFYSIEKSYANLSEAVFERWFLGQDPFSRDRLMRQAYIGLCAQHPDMLGMSVLSAIEMAMWDICGKALNRPVYDLLGGKHRDKLRAYSYINYDVDREGGIENFGQLWGDPPRLAERAIEMREEGFTALKYDPLEFRLGLGEKPVKPYHLEKRDYKMTERTMDALKDALGDQCDIIIGTHGQMTTASAISYARMLEPYAPLWLEEPTPPENMSEIARVRHSTSVPIACGERIMTVFEAERAMETGAVSILQPDLGTCGGISEAYKMAAVCEAHYVDVSPHLWGGPVLLSAAVQLSLSISNFLIQECIVKADGFYSRITTEFLKWEKGYLCPNGKPGLGIELDENYIKEVLR